MDIEENIVQIKDNIENIYMKNGYDYNYNTHYNEIKQIIEKTDDTLEFELDNLNDITNKQTQKVLDNCWNKLPKHVKRNILIDHSKELKNEYNLNEKDFDDLKNLLLKGLRELMITKKKAVEYDMENRKIIKINILEYKDNKFNLNYDSVKTYKKKKKLDNNINLYENELSIDD